MWLTLTEADISASLSNGEIEAYRKSISDLSEDPMASILADVMAEVRGYVGVRHKLAATGIPPSLKNAAADIAIYRLCKRAKTESQPQRKPAADDAVALLERVADGKHMVEDPDSGDPQTQTGAETISSETRLATRTKLKGL